MERMAAAWKAAVLAAALATIPAAAQVAAARSSDAQDIRAPSDAPAASAPRWGATATASSGAFEPNAGRWPAPVRFHALEGGVASWLDDAGWTFALLERGARGERRAWALRLEWTDSARSLSTRGEVARPRSWFVGADERRWGSTELGFEGVVMHDVAAGVDLVARVGGGEFEFDLETDPGADPAALELRWSGHCGLRVDERGALCVATELGELVLPAPTALEVGPFGASPVECRFELLDDDRFRIRALREFDGSALWIDPALEWSTYLGGQFTQSITSMEVAPNGSVVVAGVTESADYPTTPGAFDAIFSGGIESFVSILSPDGHTLERSTFLGGVADDRIVSLGLAANGEVVVFGDTASGDFPTTPGALDATLGGTSDVFFTRFSADLSSLVFSTFLGGSGPEVAGEMRLRANGAAVAVGATRGGGFPVTTGAYDTTYNGGNFAGDAFALELAPSGAALNWSTFLGGPGEELAERAALDASGDLVFSGTTFHAGFPTTFGAYDRTFDGSEEPFVARLSPNGATLRYSSFFGRSGTDVIRTLSQRSNGATLIGGETDDPAFPLTAFAHDTEFRGPTEGFLAQLSSSGAALEHSTYMGGSESDAVTTIHTDPQGRVIVGGTTLSPDFHTTPGAFDRQLDTTAGGAELDSFLVRMKSDLRAFDYATYFGGRNPDLLVAASSDAQGVLTLAGVTNGAGFPTTPDALQPAWNVTALTEGFVSRLELLLHPISYGSPKLNSGGGYATIRWQGFPSVTDDDFAVGIDLALPNVWCSVFSGPIEVNTPYCGGRLRVGPPFTRYQRFKSDFIGYGMRNVSLPAWLAGQTIYFQVWYQDESDPFGCALTDALRVLVHP